MVYQKFVPLESRTCLVRVDSYDNRNLQGSVSNLTLAHPVVFRSHMELLMLMEQLYDAANQPQRATEPRSFSPGAPTTFPPVEAGTGTSPPLATFKLNVHFRQNASWQGTLVWLEQRQEANFRSVLELMLLLDSALAHLPDDAFTLV